MLAAVLIVDLARQDFGKGAWKLFVDLVGSFTSPPWRKLGRDQAALAWWGSAGFTRTSQLKLGWTGYCGEARQESIEWVR